MHAGENIVQCRSCIQANYCMEWYPGPPPPPTTPCFDIHDHACIICTLYALTHDRVASSAPANSRFR